MGLRPKDVGQLVQQPRNVAALSAAVERIENGDVKLRVRTLEVERMLERIELRQKFVGAGLGTAAAFALLRTAGSALLQQIPLSLLTLRLAWECWTSHKNMEKLEAQRQRFANEGDGKYDDIDVYSSGMEDGVAVGGTLGTEAA